MRGAGFRQSKEERELIEQHAIKVAEAYYAANGWTVKKVGAPYDLELTRTSERWTVEVKGTTSMREAIVLTDGEVMRAPPVSICLRRARSLSFSLSPVNRGRVGISSCRSETDPPCKRRGGSERYGQSTRGRRRDLRCGEGNHCAARQDASARDQRQLAARGLSRRTGWISAPFRATPFCPWTLSMKSGPTAVTGIGGCGWREPDLSPIGGAR